MSTSARTLLASLAPPWGWFSRTITTLKASLYELSLALSARYFVLMHSWSRRLLTLKPTRGLYGFFLDWLATRFSSWDFKSFKIPESLSTFFRTSSLYLKSKLPTERQLVWIIILVLGVLFVQGQAFRLFPASHYMTVAQVHVESSTTESVPTVIATRGFFANFNASWDVQVWRLENGASRLACSGAGKSSYGPEKSGTHKMTLGEWAGNQSCDSLPPGRYYMTTAWTLRVSGGPKLVYDATDPFCVTTPRPDAAADVACARFPVVR